MDDLKESEMNLSRLKDYSFEDDLLHHFHYTLGRDHFSASHYYLFQALAYTIRDRLVTRCRQTIEQRYLQSSKQVAYLSLEFLMGRALTNAVLNLDLASDVEQSLRSYGIKLEELAQAENDAGLGNGGLGRLAACFLDSCATLSLPVTGYGIRYEYGMFNQSVNNGYQVEHPDNWLRKGHPWEISAPEQFQRIKFYGQVRIQIDKHGRQHRVWDNSQDVLAIPYDIPVPGYKNEVVNTLRLWKSEATDEFNLNEFNAGSYSEAVATKNLAEQITMVLYPNDASESGKELRLKQQYFLCSATLQDIISHWVDNHGANFHDFNNFQVFQLNDTHPSIAIPELMRILLDEYELTWHEAWRVVSQSMAYTNHTLLPEALEKWPVELFNYLLPRILEIIYEINARFLTEVSYHWPGDIEKQRNMSIIEEGEKPTIRMAYLAIVGSFSVNGVAQLHTQLLSSGLFKDFYLLWPHRFNNKTNGVTPRRWLAHCNPALARLISTKIDHDWILDFSQISLLRQYSQDSEFIEQWATIKRANKDKLSQLVKSTCDVQFDSAMMFDVQVKRIHEYKRQLLNILHVIHLYECIRNGEVEHIVPRCVLFGGKAAPGYFMAKLVIKLINNVAKVINDDQVAKPFLRVAFLPNYNVSAMEIICPATDLSEQISTTGKEASGTGNMKFMMNGALTIGTLDGANIEIFDAVGDGNYFSFGAQINDISTIRENYNPQSIIKESANLSRVVQLLESGYFNLFEPEIFTPLIKSIKDPNDQWLTAYDFDDYVAAQTKASELYKNKTQWHSRSILNTAASGYFSSDRTIAEYNKDIWQLVPSHQKHSKT